MLVEGALLAVALGLLYLLRNSSRPRRNFPPGPAGLPILGNLHQLGSEPHKTFMEMGKKYGNIFSLKFASYNVVVLNDYHDIKAAFAESAFSGRPLTKHSLQRSGGVPRGLIFNVGKSWTEQRRFTLKTLREFGLGNKKSVERIVHAEISELIETCKRAAVGTTGTPIQTQNMFNAAAINVLWTMVTGQRYSHDDPFLKDLIKGLTSSMTKSRTTALILYFPWLYPLYAKLAMFVSPVAREKKETHKKILTFVNRAVLEHQATFQMDDDDASPPRDFIDMYLREMGKTSDVSSSFYKGEGLKNLGITLLDLFVAGSETTSTALSWAFLLLALHPEEQKRFHEEIDRVVGQSRLPTLNDRPMMPYTEAILSEVLRFSSMVPTAMFHNTLEEGVPLQGYKIPKDTLIIPNLYSAMHGPQVWENPEEFLPSRFLAQQEDGTFLVKKNDAHIPFSTGKRACLGISLAQDELFLFTVSLFQRFAVGPDPNAGEKLKIDCYNASVLIPKPHNLILTDRME